MHTEHVPFASLASDRYIKIGDLWYQLDSQPRLLRISTTQQEVYGAACHRADGIRDIGTFRGEPGESPVIVEAAVEGEIPEPFLPEVRHRADELQDQAHALLDEVARLRSAANKTDQEQQEQFAGR